MTRIPPDPMLVTPPDPDKGDKITVYTFVFIILALGIILLGVALSQ